MPVRLTRAPAAFGAGVATATVPLRDLAAGLLAALAATASLASALVDPDGDAGVDLSGLKPFDSPDDLEM